MAQDDDDVTGEDAVDETEEINKDTELDDEVRFDPSGAVEEGTEVDHPLFVGAIGADLDDLHDIGSSDGSASADGYQWGDELANGNGIFALQVGEDEDDVILPWDRDSAMVVSPDKHEIVDDEIVPLGDNFLDFSDFCGKCHEAGHGDIECKK